MLKTEYNGLKFLIEEDFPEVGVYLYVYEGEKCIQDFLQNNIATCIDQAFDDYGVPKECWIKINSACK